jgi:hypothetical protein
MAKRKQLEKEQKKQQRFGSAAAAAAPEDSSTTSSSSSSPLSLGSMSPNELLRLSEMIEQGDDYRSHFHSPQGSLSPRQPTGFGAYARSDSDSSSKSPRHTPSSPEYEAMSPKSISPKRKGQGKKDGKGRGKGGVGGGIYRRTKSKRKMHSTFSKKRHTRGKRRRSRHSRK